MNDLDRMLAQRLAEVRDAHTSELGSEMHARREELFRRVRRRRLIKGAGALTGVTAVALVAVLIVPEVIERRATPPAGVDPRVHVETIKGVPNASLVASFGDSAVVIDENGGMLGIDPNEDLWPSTTVESPGCCDDLAWGKAGLWLSTSSEEGVVLKRLEPGSGGVIDRVPLPDLSGPYRLEVGERTWASQPGARYYVGVRRKDLVPEFIEAIPSGVEGYTPAALTEDRDEGGVWVLYDDESPATRGVLIRIAPVRIGPGGSDMEVGRPDGCPNSIADAGEMVWLIDPCLSGLYGYSTSGRELGTQLPAKPGAITAGLGFVWVAYPDGGYVTRHDPVTGEQVGGPIDVGEGSIDIAAGDDAVWVANEGDGTVSRITLGATSPKPRETSIPITPSPSPDQVPEGPREPSVSGIWPGITPAAAALTCPSDPEATAQGFAEEMLGWTEVDIGETGRTPGGFVLGVHGPLANPLGTEGVRAAVDVFVGKVPGEECWWVTSTGDRDLPPGVGIGVRGETATVGFVERRAATVEVRVAYADLGAVIEEVPAGDGGDIEFTLGGRPRRPGYFLLLWKDAAGTVFAAAGGPLPPGDFTAG